jgi:hypothetical protein
VPLPQVHRTNREDHLMGYQCLFDDGQEGTLLVTNLTEGDTLAVCSAHWAVWAAGFLEAVSGTAWTPVGEAVPDPETDDETDEDDAADGLPITDPGPEVQPPADSPEADDDAGDQAEDEDVAHLSRMVPDPEAELSELAGPTP